MKAPMNPAAMVIGLRTTWLEEALKVILELTRIRASWRQAVRTVTERTESFQSCSLLLVDHKQAGGQPFGCEPAMGRAKQQSKGEGETHPAIQRDTEVSMVWIKRFVVDVTVLS